MVVELVVKGAISRQRTAEDVSPWSFFRRYEEILNKDHYRAEGR